MSHPFFSSDNLQQGQFLIDKKKVGDILFSAGTYQVEVQEEKETFWPFLQISDKGKLNDHFCSCQTAEAGGVCSHQAAAWLKIFAGTQKPLHIRFKESFFAALCRLALQQHGEDVAILKGSSESGFNLFSTTKKKLFSLQPRSSSGKKILKSLTEEKALETEETSLKFSNISAEEIQLWKEGRPSPELSFELSFWADLAKWCFQAQENLEKYKIKFESDKKNLPRGVNIEFKDLSLFFYLAEAHWQELISSLVTVKSCLAVHQLSHEQIRHISYDIDRKIFHLDIDLKRETETASPHHKRVGDWVYVPDHGFYPSQIDPLLKEKSIPTSQVGSFLQRHHLLLKDHLQGSKIHEGIWPAQHHLFFDETQSLHIDCYLFEKGDLHKPNVAKFDAWVFLPDKGFFLLGDALFETIETVIPKEEVSSFVARHRTWLHGHDGFQTHIVSIGSSLKYRFSEKGIEFIAELDLTETPEDIIDFHEWIYVRGRGFYAKDRTAGASFLKGGLRIPYKEINSFVRGHQDELESVLGFFTSTSPIETSGLHLQLTEEGRIATEPLYTLAPAVKEKKVEIFEDYTFVAGSGFCEIPPHLKLPASYCNPTLIDESAELYFVSYQIDTLKPYILKQDPRVQKPDYLELQMTSLEQEADGRWLVQLSYKTNLGELPAFAVWQALNEGKRYLFSSAGLILLNAPRYNWLRGCAKKKWLKNGEQLKLTTLEWIRLFAFDQMTPPEDEEAQALWRQFHSMQSPTIPNLEGLLSKLRPYQEAGVHWLWFLYSYSLSGLLCDEMGLGKTHQAMALLAAVSQSCSQGKFLVVCPTSVIFHWQDLLARFLPKLRVLTYYGLGRTLDDFAEKYDLVLTSYGTLRSEKEVFSEHSFLVAIFDEIQAAKNSHSQTHKALKSLDAATRIGLTGTPIENNLFELKALFDVVLPDYMPTETVYKELFVSPIEKQQDQSRKKLLSRLIDPFILRRKKSEVLLELPEKVETISYAPLSEEQQKLYQEVYKSSRTHLLRELNDTSKPTPYLHIFALLTKLKQICDHPALYLNQTANYKSHSSGKWDLFVELLQETRASNQKLVVFSQYLGMLDIIESYLKQEGIGFASIRGSTRNRKEEVHRFRDDPRCEVFVGSLQAAGVGIDLISASVVIHYDRWWNPAKENQATDRVHRMGQSRGVQVFKLVTRETLEEALHALLEKKLSLAEGVLGYDDQTEFKSLTRDDLIQLFQVLDSE